MCVCEREDERKKMKKGKCGSKFCLLLMFFFVGRGIIYDPLLPLFLLATASRAFLVSLDGRGA